MKSRIPKEIEVQEYIQKRLIQRDIFPLTVFYTFLGDQGGTLAISFYTSFDLEEILEELEYKSLCDKSGFLIIEDYHTLIVTGQAILYLGEKI